MAYKKHFSTVDTKTLLGSSYNPPLVGVVVKFVILTISQLPNIKKNEDFGIFSINN
jgi:hypothetical protein